MFRRKNDTKQLVLDLGSLTPSESRGAEVLAYLKQKLGVADDYLTRELRNIDLSGLIGADEMLQRNISKNMIGALTALQNTSDAFRKTPLGDKESRVAKVARMKNAAKLVNDPAMQLALRGVPAAAVGAGVIGTGALVDAVTQSEEERLLQQYINFISNGGY